jgi:hypothetical protein
MLATVATPALATAGKAGAAIAVNGTELEARFRPIFTGDGQVLVPFRAVFRALGADVSWDRATRSATATMPDGTTINFPMDRAWATVNGSRVALPAASRLHLGWSYVPGEFLVQTLGCRLVWDFPTGRLLITNPEEESLEYAIVVALDTGKIGLKVQNRGAVPVRVTFRSSQTHDFVIRMGQKVVWRASDGQVYLMVIKEEAFAPGETRTYWSDLPSLEPGDYVVEAQFPGSSATVAHRSLSIPGQKPLTYWLLHDKDNGRLGLMVYNRTGVEVVLTFPSSQTHDFVLKREGQTVWQASAGQAYLPAVREERLAANGYSIYWTDLPWLPAGTYQAEAYFSGDGPERKVASTSISISALEPFSYRLSFQTRGLLGSGPRLGLEVRNLLDRDLILPVHYGYRILVRPVKGTGLGEVMPGVGYSHSVGTFAAGAVRYHYLYLHDLPKGAYRAEVQSNLGGSYRTVTTAYFVMP